MGRKRRESTNDSTIQGPPGMKAKQVNISNGLLWEYLFEASASKQILTDSSMRPAGRLQGLGPCIIFHYTYCLSLGVSKHGRPCSHSGRSIWDADLPFGWSARPGRSRGVMCLLILIPNEEYERSSIVLCCLFKDCPRNDVQLFVLGSRMGLFFFSFD